MTQPLGINRRMFTDSNRIEEQLANVRAVMLDCLNDTHLAQLLPANNNLPACGKMLRSRLLLTVGQANGLDEQMLIHAAAAVEIIHTASLLHDDVIDGGTLRRGAPTFWKKHGINGAILFGDLLVVKGLNLLTEINRPDLLQELIQMSSQVCAAEVEQELLLRGSPGSWAECEQIARAKTGSLFAFSAMASSDGSVEQTAALREAGYLLGTVYQLADDILDAFGNEAASGKTLGTDDQRRKTTAITAKKDAPPDPTAYIYALLEASAQQLNTWPELQITWYAFIESAIKPILKKHLIFA